ncbi:hypothetical protein [Clostridium tetanomorphum]|uniref:hypothetical protein n=2 Tax=Clostridium tetanomorphum TaxID=1553 RepID=UPI001FA933B7|nr:hypothetical protein [Clostridium tetanomorphum]
MLGLSIQIYQNLNFKVYKVGNEFIIHNTKKKFRNGHTHVHKYKICMIMIKLIKHKELPKNHNKYFLESLIRISDDKDYIKKIEDIYSKKKSQVNS